MEFVYLSEARIPSRSTNSIQTMRMCSAFAHVGAPLTLVHLAQSGPAPEGYAGDVRSFYGVDGGFQIRKLVGAPEAIASSRLLSRAGRSLPFGAYLLWRNRPGQRPYTCYSRSFLAASMAVLARRFWGRRSACRSIAMELHDEPPTRSAWRLLRQLDQVFVISERLRARIVEEDPQLTQRVSVEHDGVDLGAVRPELLNRATARARLDLPADGLLVAYTGRANAGKGVDILLSAAPHLQDLGARVLVVGKVYDGSFLSVAGPNVTFTGFVPPADVPGYLAAADVLVLPSTAELPYSAYTSPLKLFEYMASGRPVVASDLPVLGEVLEHEVNALVYPARDAHGLADAVQRIANDKALAAALAERAWEDVQAYAWDRRAERILKEITSVEAG